MAVNEKALKELLGHLVFSHTWHNFEVKERAEELLEEVSGKDEDEKDEGEKGDGSEEQENKDNPAKPSERA